MKITGTTMAFWLALAGGATAQIIEQPGEVTGLTCTYTTECFEEEACTFAQFSHDLDIAQTRPGAATLVLGTGEVEGEAQELGDMLLVRAVDESGAYMLSTDSIGYAKLSIHFAKEFIVVTYHGRCGITSQ